MIFVLRRTLGAMPADWDLDYEDVLLEAEDHSYRARLGYSTSGRAHDPTATVGNLGGVSLHASVSARADVRPKRERLRGVQHHEKTFRFSRARRGCTRTSQGRLDVPPSIPNWGMARSDAMIRPRRQI